LKHAIFETFVETRGSHLCVETRRKMIVKVASFLSAF